MKVAILLVIGIILLVWWLLGFVTAYTLGGVIYVALVIGLILVAIWLVQYFRGRRQQKRLAALFMRGEMLR